MQLPIQVKCVQHVKYGVLCRCQGVARQLLCKFDDVTMTDIDKCECCYFRSLFKAIMKHHVASNVGGLCFKCENCPFWAVARESLDRCQATTMTYCLKPIVGNCDLWSSFVPSLVVHIQILRYEFTDMHTCTPAGMQIYGK